VSSPFSFFTEMAEISHQMLFLGSSRVWGFVLFHYLLRSASNKSHRALNKGNVDLCELFLSVCNASLYRTHIHVCSYGT
jgi:hypothetical protein